MQYSALQVAEDLNGYEVLQAILQEIPDCELPKEAVEKTRRGEPAGYEIWRTLPELGQKCPDHLRKDLARALYWGCGMVLPTHSISKWILPGVYGTEFENIIAIPDAPCSVCDADITLYHRGDLSLVGFGPQALNLEAICRLCQLKKMPYREYLLTRDWGATRARALRRGDGKCCVCGTTKSLNVHHRTYVRRGEEWDEDLLVLCRSCHETFHRNGKLAKES